MPHADLAAMVADWMCEPETIAEPALKPPRRRSPRKLSGSGHFPPAEPLPVTPKRRGRPPKPRPEPEPPSGNGQVEPERQAKALGEPVTPTAFWRKAEQLDERQPWRLVADRFGLNLAQAQDCRRHRQLPPGVSPEAARAFVTA